MPRFTSLIALIVAAPMTWADAPVAVYIFPAGGQRGTTVNVKVGGLFLYDRCDFEMLGPGLTAPSELKRTSTLWLEGPVLPLPDSQRQEDYPKDMAATIKLNADAPLGPRAWRVWTSQGVTPARRFVVGDLPEIIEEEFEGDPIPTKVTLPVTINGRIFPAEDVDIWTVSLKKGQSVTALVDAARLGSPLDSRLEVRGPDGKIIGENDDAAASDSMIRFTASEEGLYQVKIHDIAFKGSQSHVYRLTLTSDPHVDHVYPLGGKRGSRGNFTLTGQGLPNTTQTIEFPATAPSVFQHRLKVGDKLTNPFTLDIDDFDEVMESEGKPTTIQAPVIANGRIAKPSESDRWLFTAKKGDVFDLELRAQKLGSPLTGLLSVEDDKGKSLLKVEAGAAGKPDAFLRFTAPADGTYAVVIAEKFRGFGGPQYAYRLRFGRIEEQPDFRLQAAVDALTIPRGGQINLAVKVEALGTFKQPITLAVEGLPADVTVTGMTLTAGQAAATLVFKTTATTKIQCVPVVIKGTAKVGEKTLTRTAVVAGDLSMETMRVAVGLPTPFKVVGTFYMGWAARGSEGKRKYKIERNGFEGPLTVMLADRQARHLQGVTGPTITVPAGATEFEYPVTMPPWMEIGRTCRVCVMAVGVLQEADGSKHHVSFNSVNQNEQFVAVMQAGELDLATDVTSARAEAGTSVSIPVRLTRGKGLDGPVTVSLVMPAHVKGVIAPAITIPENETTGTLTIRFEGKQLGPFNMPLAIQASMATKSGKVIAEAKISVAAAHP